MMSTRQEADLYVVAELAKAGLKVFSVYDLVNTKRSYPEVIPVLLNCLAKVDDPIIKEGLVRALTVKEAIGIANKQLIREFLSIPPDSAQRDQFLKWTIGNALAVIATDADYADLVRIATAKEHGKAREMVVVALGRMKSLDAGEVLIALLDDAVVAGHAAMALAKLKYIPAMSKLKSLRSNQKTWVAKEIERAIKKLSA